MTDLITRLIPVVDRLRRLHDRIGTRPYRVWHVLTTWTGGRRGEGEEVVVAAREIVPTPLVSGIESLTAVLEPEGRREDGIVEVSQISLSLTEAEAGYGWGREIADGSSMYWEIRYADGNRRRFTPISAPERDVRSMGWRIRLQRQMMDRERDGTPYR